jgi:hypothetical protein
VNGNNLVKLSLNGNELLILEVDLLLIKIGTISTEKGKPSETVHSIYVSPKLTIKDLKIEIARLFGIKEDFERTRLWMKKELFRNEVLDKPIEDFREIKPGMKFYIEQMVDGTSSWPSEPKNKKNDKSKED